MNRGIVPVILFIATLVGVEGFSQDSLDQVVPSDPVYRNMPDDVHLGTPYQTVLTHLTFLQPENYDPARAAMTLDVEDPSSDEAKQLALQLIQIFDGHGLYVDLEEIPDVASYADSVTGKQRYVMFKSYPEIYLVKRQGIWLYSERTVKAIPRLHAETYPFGTGKLLNLFPREGQTRFLGLQLWQYVGILILAALVFVVHKILTWLFGFVLSVLVNKLGQKEIAQRFIRPVAKPVSLLAINLLLFVLIPVLQLPIVANKYVILILKAFIPVFMTLIVYKLVNLLGEFAGKLAEKTESSLNDQLIPLIRKIIKVVVVIGGFIFVLQNLGVNVTALAAVLSVGALGLGLASQDTVRNLFGSIMIYVDRPFKLGDLVKLGDVSGSIEEVGIRSTRVRTFDNSLVSIPNGRVADMTIDNISARQYRRFKADIAITYDTPPSLVEAFRDGIGEIILKHPVSRKDVFVVRLFNLGDSALVVFLNMFFETDDFMLELKSREEIILAILRLAEKLGVRFAFPTTTMHVENFPEKKTLAPVYDDSPENMQKKVKEFMEHWSVNPPEVKPPA